MKALYTISVIALVSLSSAWAEYQPVKQQKKVSQKEFDSISIALKKANEEVVKENNILNHGSIWKEKQD